MIILPGPIPDPHLGGLSTRFTNVRILLMQALKNYNSISFVMFKSWVWVYLNNTLISRVFLQIFIIWILFWFHEFFSQYLPGQGDHALFSPPSSTSGTDSSLRIRKTGNSQCTERKWFISVSLAMIFTLVIASAGIYFGCKKNILFWITHPTR